MRHRILKMMIASLVAMGVMFGVPMTIITWDWFATSAHQDLSQRLKRMSEHVLAEEAAGRAVQPHDLDLEQFRLLVPSNGRLTLTYRVPDPTAPGGYDRGTRQLGYVFDGAAVSESVNLGPNADLTLAIPQEDVRPTQLLAVLTMLLAILVAVVGGAMVAVVTARRLSEPLSDVARRAAAMAHGDFSSDWPTYGIDELDRVSAALADANDEIALRLEREGEIIGDVSHQLRSRLTAIHLRLDELTLHEDPAVVAEAEAGMEQVERLADELDEMIAASRADSKARAAIDVAAVVETLVHDFEPAYRAAGRSLRMVIDEPDQATYGRPGRLREALSVLVDNALVHGAGDCVVRVGAVQTNEMVRITVSDEGDGVADDLVPGIFRRGVSGGGRSGLGLSLARALVEADGGRLDLVSRRPAVFSVVAPMHSATGGLDAGEESGGADGAGPDVTRVRVPHR
ncbi:HAMP domain-containing sensor histidine kinase [Gordonia neofelifaecis]|uniref:Signal transduction histidine-protein kinase/phosphatase MprB n=1 Tax=Gordonia neofelifaecis NRRL B-59395 TaxID=644548 RepID=F1YF88_9ACTN|nr:HAMP domain-containing sensor histidine kinase [Gordonia neofelifaecis]EGD56627.1 ATP-binding region ATPase domain-containing protein [Gordonia neofelifaecis NRRL B-59395]